MSTELALIVFLVLTSGLIVLPFVPAIVEWRRKIDAQPLRVVRDSQVDIRHFASGFREFVEGSFAALLDACRESKKTERGTLEDGTPYIVVGDRGTQVSKENVMQGLPDNRLVLAAGDLRLAGNTLFAAEIYAEGSVVGGEKNVLRAILAEKDINLGPDSTTLRWLHGGRSVNVESGCVLYGRASADDSIHIDEDCRFERLNAPRIQFSSRENPGTSAVRRVHGKRVILNRFDISNRVETAAGRWLVFGDMKIPDGKIVGNDLVVTGCLDIGERVLVKGSIKSRKEMHVGPGVEVEGSVVCERDIHIESDCRISGPVLSERTIFIRSGSSIGSREHPTTVSSGKIFIEPGVSVYGSVWAHQEGRVTSLRPEEPGENRNESVKT
jgi:predicted acyltransferase (DUF342 family)